jgi:hypothetical protein
MTWPAEFPTVRNKAMTSATCLTSLGGVPGCFGQFLLKERTPNRPGGLSTARRVRRLQVSQYVK